MFKFLDLFIFHVSFYFFTKLEERCRSRAEVGVRSIYDTTTVYLLMQTIFNLSKHAAVQSSNIVVHLLLLLHFGCVAQNIEFT